MMKELRLRRALANAENVQQDCFRRYVLVLMMSMLHCQSGGDVTISNGRNLVTDSKVRLLRAEVDNRCRSEKCQEKLTGSTAIDRDRFKAVDKGASTCTTRISSSLTLQPDRRRNRSSCTQR